MNEVLIKEQREKVPSSFMKSVKKQTSRATEDSCIIEAK